MSIDIKSLREKALWVRKETLNIHRIAQQTRLASSLSCVEIFVSLYYGGILSFNPLNPKWKNRDRFIISKGHGSISFYPILSDLGYFRMEELENVCKAGSFLGAIPDAIIPSQLWVMSRKLCKKNDLTTGGRLRRDNIKRKKGYSAILREGDNL